MITSSSILALIVIVLVVFVGVVVVAWMLVKYGTDENLLEGTAGKANQPASDDYYGSLKEGDKLYQEYRYKEALPYYLDAVKMNNQDTTLHFRIGRIYETLGEYNQAETSFKNLLIVDANSADALFELSKMNFKQNKKEQARKYVEQLLQKHPDHEEGVKLKVRILIEQNEYGMAGEVIEGLLKKEPGNAELQYMLGKIYQKTNREEEAMKIYFSLLPGDPHDKRNLKFHIYEIYEQWGEYNNAIEMLEDILNSKSGTISRDELKREMAGCWCLRAEEFLKSGEFDDAEVYFNKALEYDSRNPLIFSGLGRIYAAKGDKEAAMEYYQKGLDLGPGTVQSYIELAKLYEQMDRYDEAVDCMRRAEEVVPSAQVYYYLGTLYGLKGDLVSCTNYLHKAIARHPEFIDAYYNLAVAFEQQRKFKEALSMYKKVLDLDKDHVEARTNFRHLQNRLSKW